MLRLILAGNDGWVMGLLCYFIIFFETLVE